MLSKNDLGIYLPGATFFPVLIVQLFPTSGVGYLAGYDWLVALKVAQEDHKHRFVTQ